LFYKHTSDFVTELMFCD